MTRQGLRFGLQDLGKAREALSGALGAGVRRAGGETPDHRLVACRSALLAFLAAVDHGRATDALDCFTADADFGARGLRLRGHPPILAFLREREADNDRRTVHVVCNEIVRLDTRDEVVLDATVLLHERRDDGTYPVVRALDTSQTFRREGRRWRIDVRTTRPIHP